jgi:hypothetical protein
MSAEQMKDFGQLTYAAVGKCIYCGATERLENEHIVPYALNGSTILPRSTCRSCAKITGQFEQSVLRGPMRAVRVLRQFKSRTKHADAPRTAALSILRGGNEESVDLPLEEYPILLHFPLFAPPGYLTPSEYSSGIRLTGVATILFGPPPEEVARRLGATKLNLSQGYYPAAFGRMIAKIAYSYAFAEGATQGLRQVSPMLPALLGKSDDIGRWVGTLPKQLETHPGLLHRLALREDRENGLLVAEVQLFADSSTPSYGVVLGEL